VPNTKRHMRLRLYPYTHAHIHPCSHRHTTTQVTITQRQLPPRTMAFASTTNSICQHNQTHLSDDLPTHSKAFAPTTKGICPHNQRHLPPQPNSRALAPTTKLTCFHNAWTFCVEKFHTQQKCQPQHKKPNGICQHYQGHVPTHSMAFAPTTKLTYLQESL
jgi:hypothetical protein